MTQMRNKSDCHKLRVLATNGRIFQLTVEEIKSLLSSRLFCVPLFMFCLILALIDPLVFQNNIALPWRVLFWATNGLFVTLIWYAQFRLLAWIWTTFEINIPLPSPLLIALSVTMLLLFNYGIATTVLEMPEMWEAPLWSDLLRYVLAVLVFGTAIATFLLPPLLDRYRRAETGPEIAPQPEDTPEKVAEIKTTVSSLSVNGRAVDISAVLYLKSAEHYVEVVLHDTTELIRASLRQIIGAVDPSHGVQPHRSYWVARHAIVGINRVRGSSFLVLVDGTEVPISRHRKRDVSEWLAQNL